MAIISVDPFAWIDQWRKTTKTFTWISLIFQMAFSAIVTFLFIGGTTMLTAIQLGSHHPVITGLATAMIWVSLVLTVLWRRSNLTKGMILVAPQAEANQEVKEDIQVVQK